MSEWGTGEVLTWPQMKRVYGLKDNTTEHSEYKRLAEQLERPEWAQLRQYWKWAAIEERAHGQKTERRAPDRVRKVKAARKAPTCYGGGTEEDEHGWEYLCEWEGEQSDSWVWHDKMPHTWERELMHAQGARRQAASFREWLEHRRRLGGSGPEAAQADRALETCDGESNAPSWSDVLDRFIEYSREVNGVCTSAPNMTEHTFEEGRTRTDIRVEGKARTLYLGGKKPAQDSGTQLGSREDGDTRVIKLEGTPGLDTNATWEEEIPEQNKITADAVEKMMERPERERQKERLTPPPQQIGFCP